MYNKLSNYQRAQHNVEQCARMHVEIICIRIGTELIICCVYVPPESSLSHVSSLVYFVTNLTSSFSKCIFVGDFNFPYIDWFALMGTSPSSICFCNLVFDCNLTQHVLEPTHVKGNVLVLVLTSASVVIDILTIRPLSAVNFSDHLAISFDLPGSVPTVSVSKPGYVLDFCKADSDGLC